MLEILLLIVLCKRLGKEVRKKGYKSIGYQLALIGLWFGAEFATGMISYILLYSLFDNNTAETFFFVFYFLAIVGALVTTWLLFRYVDRLPIKQSYPTI